MKDSLPVEFSALAGKVDYVQKVNAHEWSSSCPNCGGAPHKNGDYPDRFRMWTNASGKNKVMGWCRQCSYVWFPSHEKPPSPEEFERWRREQIAREEQRKAEAEQAIKLLRSQRIWEFYHQELNTWAYEVLESWGICRENAAYWKLGLIKDYLVYPDKYHSPAISIPIWGADGEVKNVKVRVLNPQSDKDRYRALYKTGQDDLFFARPGEKFDRCLVVEGEKKAMVAAAVKQDMQVVGVPTKTPSARALSELKNFNEVTVCLDPDAFATTSGISPIHRMVDILGEQRTKVLRLFGKLDDMILQNNLSLEDALKYAKRRK